MGTVDFLFTSGIKLDRSDCLERSQTLCSTLLQDAHKKGDFNWLGSQASFHYGFYRGYAGIGYTCMRLIDSSLPAITLFE
jgi:lantibiotic modifying enzyme